MADDQNLAEDLASADTVAPEAEQTPETETNTEVEGGQIEAAPSEDQADKKPEAEETMTRSKAKREARKAREQKLERDLAEAQAKLSEVDQHKARESKPRPVESTFDSLEEYQAALTAYSVSEQLNEREAQDVEQERGALQQRLQGIQQERQQEQARKWAEETAEARKVYPDFDAVVQNAALPIPPHVAEEILASEDTAGVAYHIGKNPDVARHLAGLTGAPLAREMGRIEAMLSMPQAKKVTSAPDPINPVTSQSTGSKDPAKMNATEYKAWREKGGGS